MTKPYHFLPEVRQAERRAGDAEQLAERLAEDLVRALQALAAFDLSTAQAIRGRAFAYTRGHLPHAASRLHRLALNHPAREDDSQESSR